jgi:hypothetical protein
MFNLNEVTIEDNFAPLEQGTYSAFIEKMEWKTSKTGADYLNVQWKLTESNRVIFDILNLFHPTEQVRNIALGTVKKMLTASGFEGDLNFATKEALCLALAEVRCDVFLKIEEQEGYAPKNVIKGYSKTEAPAPTVDTSDIPF